VSQVVVAVGLPVLSVQTTGKSQNILQRFIGIGVDNERLALGD
jgi:hypothetical protein